MSKLSIVIVNYNTREILKKCLENLFSLGCADEIIVVDNASPDGAADMVEQTFPAQQYPTLRLIRAPNNGLAAGSNIGLKASIGEYVVYLGSDAFPDKGTIEGIAAYMEVHATVGIATPKLVLRTGELDRDCHRGFPTPRVALTHFSGVEKLFPHSRLFAGYFLGWQDMSVPHEIDMCISHFMVVRRKVFDRIGLWDETFFVYGEDVDFCYRAKQAGWQVMYLSQFTATHYKGVSVGVRKESKDLVVDSAQTRATAKKMRVSSVRAMRMFYEKHMAKRYPGFVTWFVLAAVEVMGLLRLR